MNIGELKDLIKDLDNDDVVVLSSDAEGNRFIECGGYSTDTRYMDDDESIFHLDDLEEYEEYGYTKETGVSALVLWPN